jgi:hypothetical protein
MGPDRRHLTRQTPNSHLVSLALLKAWSQPLRVRRVEARQGRVPEGAARARWAGVVRCGGATAATGRPTIQVGLGTPNGNGGRHCCQPPLRRAKDLPVFVTWLIEAFALPTRSRSWLTSSGVASHRAAPSSEEPGCPTRLRRPKVRLSFVLPGPVETVISTKTTPRSAALLGKPSIASRFAHRNSEELREPRRTTGRFLFRRLLPAGSNANPKALTITCRRRSDLWSPAAPACRCRLLGRPGPPSRSHEHHALPPRVAEAKFLVTSLWITGISGATVGTLSK